MEGVFHETTILVDERPVARHDDGWTTIDVDLDRGARGQDAASRSASTPCCPTSADSARRARRDARGQTGLVRSCRAASGSRRGSKRAHSAAYRRSGGPDAEYDGRRGVVRARGALSQPPQGASLASHAATRRRRRCGAERSFPLVSGDSFDVSNWSPDAPNVDADGRRKTPCSLV